MIRLDCIGAFNTALATMPPADEGARAAAAARQASLTKPAGSLGRLEEIAIFMAGWQGTDRPRLDRGLALIFAGNHGVVAQGVSAFPADVTAQMVANFRSGGAAINQLARAAGLDFKVVPLDLDRPTADITSAPAMSEAECLAAMEAGAAAVPSGLDLLVLGEMGIGNTTAAAAIALRSFGGEADDWIGRGTGIDDAGLARKRAAVTRAMDRHGAAPMTAFETLRCVGGREIAAMAGAILAARHARVPVLLDGFIGTAAIAPMAVQEPAVTAHCLAGHCSAEPGHARLLDRIGLDPLLHLGLRLGEGSGAATAALLVRAALATHDGMATFAQAQVATRT